ncbi:MAG TPA: DUF4177 domain-containing protein [Candidatus Hydrogenedentes bacterium]|nr:DUF4177 domain-containing protein [Candidatus Hydrogenedentota bacterium]
MERRYEYHFERIKVNASFWRGNFSTDYQGLVALYAQNGWRFIQIYAPGTAKYGASKYADLIFEREVR